MIPIRVRRAVTPNMEMFVMETHREEGIWRRFSEKFKTLREELKKDSVASNPRKPVDCCNPPVAPRMDKKPEKE